MNFLFTVSSEHLSTDHFNQSIGQEIKIMREPGFEPGSTAWKAAILTTRLFAHAYHLTHTPLT